MNAACNDDELLSEHVFEVLVGVPGCVSEKWEHDDQREKCCGERCEQCGNDDRPPV